VAYEESVQKRSDSQREVNSLLERKSMWTDADVSRFTALVREDHALEQAEARAKAAVARTEDEVEREFSALMRTILARYHEEQVWSDKIRSVSTYGQLAVLGVNVLVFALAIVLVEPWKRRRLMQAFERRVQEMEAANVDAVVGGLDAMKVRLEEQGRILARFAEGSSAAPPLALALAPLLALQEERMGAVEEEEEEDGPRRSAVEFAGFTLAREDAKLIAASVSAGMLAWALRGWVGL
jgi:sensitive to high expression protein 9